MKIFLRIILVFVLSIASYFSSAQFERKWQGVLKVNGTQLDLKLDIQKSGNEYAAFLDIIQQGAKELKASKVEIEKEEIIIEWAELGFGIGGNLNNDGNFEAMFMQGAFSETILFTPDATAIAYNRPQEPKPKFPYKSEAIHFTNEKEQIKLSGTLSVPFDVQNPTIVVLISGSGQQDRDGTVFGHKPFLVLSDYLTRNGIGVFRYDDRGVGTSEKGSNLEKATSENFAEDAKAAIAYLRKRGYTKIGIIGHSEGGMIAPMVASADSKIKFIVTLAGPGENGGDVIIDQSFVALDTINNREQALFNQELNKVAIADLRKGSSIATMEENLDAYIKQSKGGATMEYNQRKEMVQYVINSYNNNWLKYFILYNPETYFSKIKCPVFALNGSKDVQILSNQNLAGMERMLQKSGNKNYKVMEMEGLNHLFQPAESGLVDEYEKIEITFDPTTMKLIKDWILKIK